MKKLLFTILILITIISCPIAKANDNKDYFTIVALPDTQFYSQSYPEIFTLQTQWIVDNREKENIVFVAHLGDIVDRSRAREWDNAKAAMDILADNGVPYSVVTGNHDIVWNSRRQQFSTRAFNSYFPHRDFEGNNWYGGHYPSDSNENNYALVSVGDIHLLILNIGLPFTEGSSNWSNSIVKAYHKRKVIAVVHGYIDSNGVKAVDNNVQGAEVWEQVIRKHDNIIMVLCGHSLGELHTIDKGDKGNKIHNLLSNYQHRETGGASWLRLYRFYPDLNEVKAQTYSPLLNQYEEDGDSQFEFASSLESSPHPTIPISNSNSPNPTSEPIIREIVLILFIVLYHLAFITGIVFGTAFRSLKQGLRK